MIRTVDTDVVVLAITFFHRLSVHELWIAFGVGKKYRYISVHDIALHLGEHSAETLGGFHAFTGCDRTLSSVIFFIFIAIVYLLYHVNLK